MQDYVTLGVLDEMASNRFYDAVMAAIGWGSHRSFPGWRAYSKGASGEGLVVWICKPFDGAPATTGNGTMLGLAASSHAQVDAFHAAALAHGGTSEGEPGARLIYGPNWYAAYVRDPAGNKLAAAFNG